MSTTWALTALMAATTRPGTLSDESDEGDGVMATSARLMVLHPMLRSLGGSLVIHWQLVILGAKQSWAKHHVSSVANLSCQIFLFSIGYTIALGAELQCAQAAAALA